MSEGNIWMYLVNEGIHTKEQLHQRIKTMPKINIGLFISRGEDYEQQRADLGNGTSLLENEMVDITSCTFNTLVGAV